MVFHWFYKGFRGFHGITSACFAKDTVERLMCSGFSFLGANGYFCIKMRSLGAPCKTKYANPMVY